MEVQSKVHKLEIFKKMHTKTVMSRNVRLRFAIILFASFGDSFSIFFNSFVMKINVFIFISILFFVNI
jgi:hypothetical protein